MLKKIIQVSCLISLGTTLLGCTLSHQPSTCDQLKRQWLYYTTNPNAENGNLNIDQLRQKMHQQNCM
jgi:hypothetical protein